jgi:NitT/TauT family transport system permease protein
MRKYLILGPVALVGLWFLICHAGLVDRLLLPPPEQVARKLVYLFTTGQIWRDLEWTMIRWTCGLVLGTVVGVPLGLLMGASKRFYASLEVLVDFFRSIPVMAMFPIFLVFFGLGDRSKIAISAWTTILYVLINTLYGVRHGSEARRMVARVFRASPWQTFSKVIFPEALPDIFVGMRISVSMSLVLVVAAEMIMGTTVGLGKRILDASLTYSVSEMYATIIVAGTLGYVSNKLFVWLEQNIVHWAAV